MIKFYSRHFMCVNFIHFILSEVDAEHQIVDKLYRGNITIRVFAGSKLPKKYFFIFVFM